METLRDTNDAREWQEATKSLLVDEVRSRASKAMDENADFLTTLHSSIDLFKNNVDLIPGTRDFDVELANEFARTVEPYELRVDGKLQGYSIPVQPIVDQIRTRIAGQRKNSEGTTSTQSSATEASQPGKGASTPPTPAATSQAAPEQPQAGISSKAGSGPQGEDFSALFGTLGLPDLQI